MTISSIAPSVTPNVAGASSSIIGTAILAKSLDSFQQSGEGVVKMMEQSVNPNVGKNIDMRV